MMVKRLGLLLILALMVSAIPITHANSECDFTYSNYARAVQLNSMGDFSRAAHHYDCALQQNPDNPILLRVMGDLYRDYGYTDIAQTYYDRIPTNNIPTIPVDTTCDPTYSHYARGVQHHWMGELSRALYHYNCALAETPNRSTLLKVTGDLYLDMGYMVTAQAYYERANANTTVVDSSCDTTYSHYARGAELYDMRDFSRARKHFECALAETPNRASLLKMMGDIYLESGDLITAQSYYDRADVDITLVDPSCDFSYSNHERGAQLYAMHEYFAAIHHFECELARSPDSVALLSMIAQAYLEVDYYETALSYYDQLIQLDDQNALFYSQRGYVKYLLERYQEALLDLNIALDLNPELSSAQRTLALVLEALGQAEVVAVAPAVDKNIPPQLDDDFGGGLTALPIAETAPTSPQIDTLRQAAHEFFGAKKFDLAIEQYMALLAYEPNNPETHFSLAYSFEALDQPEQALVYLQQTLELNPNHLYAQYFLAMTYAKLGQQGEAFAIMDDIVSKNRQDGSYHLAKGHVYRNLNFDEAAGFEFYSWMQAHELIRMVVDMPADRIPTTLVLDQGVVYEMPFQAVAGNTVQISVQSHLLNPKPIDPLIVVLNAEGVAVSGDDDNGVLFDSMLNFVPPTTGDYILLVSHAGGGSTGDLTLTMTGLAWSADTYRDLAYQAFIDHNYDRGIEMLTKAIVLGGGTGNDYMTRAYAYRRLGNYMDAITDYHLALVSYPYPEEVYANLGQTYNMIFDLDSAALAYSQALSIDPNYIAVRCELGHIFANWSDYESAILQYDMILMEHPTNECALDRRAFAIRMLGVGPANLFDDRVETIYRVTLSQGVNVLLTEIERLHDTGDVLMAEGLMDRYRAEFVTSSATHTKDAYPIYDALMEQYRIEHKFDSIDYHHLLEAIYDVSISISDDRLMYEAQIIHEKGDVWLASALLDRYIDEHYSVTCSTQLSRLADDYQADGYTVMANMMYLKGIGDSTC